MTGQQQRRIDAELRARLRQLVDADGRAHRIIDLEADTQRVTAERDEAVRHLRGLKRRYDEIAAALDRVWALHPHPEDQAAATDGDVLEPGTWCPADGQTRPCPTRAAIWGAT